MSSKLYSRFLFSAQGLLSPQLVELLALLLRLSPHHAPSDLLQPLPMQVPFLISPSSCSPVILAMPRRLPLQSQTCSARYVLEQRHFSPCEKLCIQRIREYSVLLSTLHFTLLNSVVFLMSAMFPSLYDTRGFHGSHVGFFLPFEL